MNGFAAFLKDIFSFSDDNTKVGLSQFKMAKEKQTSSAKKAAVQTGEVKLSDLMRRSF